MLYRHIHVRIHRTQGGTGILILHHQASHLPQRSQATACNHGGSNNAPHGQFGFLNQIHPDNHHADGDHLLQHLHRVYGQGGSHLDARTLTSQVLGGLLPIALRIALRIQDLQGFHTSQGFDQAGVTLGSSLEGLFGQTFHTCLSKPGNTQDDHNGHNGRDQHPGRDPGQHSQKQQHKWQIDQCRQTGRSDKVAHRFKRAQIGSKRAHRRRSVLHAQVQHPLHNPRGQLNIHPFAGSINYIGSHTGEHHVHDQHQPNPNRQYPQGFNRFVGNHPVVHVHGVERNGQRKQVDQQGSANGVAIQTPVLHYGCPEPVFALHGGHTIFGTRFDAEIRLHHGQQPGVLRLQIFQADVAGAATFREMHPGTFFFQPQQHTCPVIVQQQNNREQIGVEFGKGATPYSGRAMTTRGRSTEQGRRQTPTLQRQACRQVLRRARITVDTGNLCQAGQKRIIMRQMRRDTVLPACLCRAVR